LTRTNIGRDNVQIKLLKNHKSLGEFLKNEGEELLIKEWKLMCQIWKSIKTTEEWKTVMICPIHKKGSM